MYQKKANKKTSTILLVTLLVLNFSPLSGILVYADEALVVEEAESSTTSSAVAQEIPTQDVPSSEGTSTTDAISSSNTTDFSLQENTTTSGLTDMLDSSSASSSTTFISTGTTTDATTASGSLEVVSTTTEFLPPEVIYEDATDTLPSGTTTITTGEAVAMANILNIVNTNLINSTGSIVLANVPEGYNGTLDLRNTSSPFATSSCTLLACNGIDSITAKITADAAIDNIIALTASSGNNQVDTSEHAVIATGDTYAGLNLVNVANTNLIDSNYFLLSLNSFKNINGDIVLPSLSNFFSTMSDVLSNSTVNMQATADTVNNLTVAATTGANAIQSANGSIHTGSTISSTNVYNNSNSSLIGGGSVSILLKISGQWAGELFGTPSGSAFTVDGKLRTLSIGATPPVRRAPSIETDIMSTSTARISNTARLFSDSGNNQTLNTTDSQITTGNAYASANVINIANANVVGRNWILAIINIFGDFNGNVAFGRPDLWLGEQVSTDPIIQNGSILTYTVTVINKGDSDATGVQVSSVYDKEHLDILDASIPFIEDVAGNLVFTHPTLVPGDAKEIVFHARIRDTVPGTQIVNTSTVTEHESDNSVVDNTDTTTITTSIIASGGGGGGGTLPQAVVPITITPMTLPPSPTGTSIGQTVTVEVRRGATSTTLVGAGSVGEQVLTIHNLSNVHIPGVVFDDVLYDDTGKQVRTETFDIGDMLPYEEITLTYSLSFGAGSKAGIYTFSSELHHSVNQTLLYGANGSIVYVVFGGSTGNSMNSGGSNGEGIHQATSLLRGSLVASTGTPIIIFTNVKKKSTSFGWFIDSFLPERAYAAVLGEGLYSERSTSYSWLVLFLFLIISGSHIYHRYIRLLNKHNSGV